MMRVASRFGLLLLTTTCAVQARQADAAALQCRDLPALLSAFRSHHYLTNQSPETLETRTAERFVASIDPTRTLLLRADVDRLLAELPTEFSGMRTGDCRILDTAWSIVASRAAEDERVAREMLTPTYKIDDSVTIVVDPEKRAYATTSQERAARVRDLVHFQMSSYLEAGLDMEQAKKQLLHRYELVRKRINERKEKGQLPEMFAEAYGQALDPHTDYISPDALADFNIQMHLSLEGIGAVLRSEDGFTLIESLVPGGGAEKSGLLRPKDKIIAVSQQGEQAVSTLDMALDDVVKMIRGKKGTKVTLTVLREGKSTKTFQVTIVRDKIDISSQAAKITYETRKRDNRTLKIGVIDLPSFYGGSDEGRSCSQDVENLLNEAKKEKVDAVVLDLTRNGGGLLDEAVRVAGLFIKKGAVVGTKDSSGRFEVLEDEDDRVVYSGPLTVMISRGSASASEILAGMLKDYRRALIVGSDRTFGKGSVQAMLPLPRDLGAIKVTTAMFFLPGGASTQHQGVQPDIRVPQVFDAYDIGEADLKYALPPQKVTPFLSATAKGTKPGESWQPLDAALVQKLAAASAARVGQAPEFKKLAQEISEIEKNRGVVRLGDVRKRPEEPSASLDPKADGKGKPDKGAHAAPGVAVTEPPERSPRAGDASAPTTTDTSSEPSEDELKTFEKVTLQEGIDIAADAVAAMPSRSDDPGIGSPTQRPRRSPGTVIGE